MSERRGGPTAALTRFATTLALLVVGAAGLWLFFDKLTDWYRIRDLEAANAKLRKVVGNLSGESRRAEIAVINQRLEAAAPGKPPVKVTDLLFVEYGRNGQALPPRMITVRGESAHFDAMVIKFERDLVGEGDPLRGKTLALFLRAYGDQEAPDAGIPIDSPAGVPAFYASAEADVKEFEIQLWHDFWRLAADEPLRKEKGVRAVMGQSAWEPLKPDVLYTLTLENSGGLNMNRTPAQGMLKELLQQKMAAAKAATQAGK
jgi:hypothetical protein